MHRNFDPKGHTIRTKNKATKEVRMELHFPHLTNGIGRKSIASRQRARTLRNTLLATAILGLMVISASYAFASTMNQEMIAQEEALQVEVCYQLKSDINGVMYGLLISQEMKDITPEQAELLERLTTSYANYCKD